MRISDWSSDVCSSDLYRPEILNLGVGVAPMDVHPVGCRLRLARRAEAFEIRESLFSLGGSVDDRGLVAAEDTEPMRHIARMTVMEDVGQTKVSTAEPRPDLGAITRSEEHTSELQSLMPISDADFCL